MKQTETILLEFMKGNYKDCEIEEMTLFIDGLLPLENHALYSNEDSNEDLVFKQQEQFDEVIN